MEYVGNQHCTAIVLIQISGLLTHSPYDCDLYVHRYNNIDILYLKEYAHTSRILCPRIKLMAIFKCCDRVRRAILLGGKNLVFIFGS